MDNLSFILPSSLVVPAISWLGGPSPMLFTLMTRSWYILSGTRPPILEIVINPSMTKPSMTKFKKVNNMRQKDKTKYSRKNYVNYHVKNTFFELYGQDTIQNVPYSRSRLVNFFFKCGPKTLHFFNEHNWNFYPDPSFYETRSVSKTAKKIYIPAVAVVPWHSCVPCIP